MSCAGAAQEAKQRKALAASATMRGRIGMAPSLHASSFL
jgi:hypothetical protein